MAEKEPDVPYKIGANTWLCAACCADLKVWRQTKGAVPALQRPKEPSVRTADLMVQGTSICFEHFEVQPRSSLVVANGQVPLH